MEKICENIGNFISGKLWNLVKQSKTFREIKIQIDETKMKQAMEDMLACCFISVQNSLELPDSVIEEVLGQDEHNKELLLKSVIYTENDLEADFNIQPYIEKYPEYSDRIACLYSSLLIEIQQYKKRTWKPEVQEVIQMLQGCREVLSQLDLQLQCVEEKANKRDIILNQKLDFLINRATEKTIETMEDVDITDISNLVQEGRESEAIIKAIERLNSIGISAKSKCKLLVFISDLYMRNKFTIEKAIPYLEQAYVLSNDLEEKKLLHAWKLFAMKDYDAAWQIGQSISDAGCKSKDKHGLLLNISIVLQKYDDLNMLLEKYPQKNESLFRAIEAFQKSDYSTLDKIFHDYNIPDKRDEVYAQIAIYYLIGNINRINTEIMNNSIINQTDIIKESMDILQLLEQWKVCLGQVKELKGLFLLFQGKYMLAKDVLKELVDMYGGASVSNYIRACNGCDDYDSIIECIHQFGLDAVDFYSIVLYCNALFNKKQFEKIEEFLLREKERFIINGRPILYYQLLQDLYWQTLQFDKNEVMIQELMEKEPLAGIFCRAHDFSLRDNFKCAQIEFQHFMQEIGEQEITDDYGVILCEYIDVLKRLHEWDEILSLYQKIPQWYEYDEIYSTVVVALFNLGKYSKVLELYKKPRFHKTVVLEECTALVYYNRGWFVESLQIYEDLYKRLGKLEYLTQMASCEQELGNAQKCIQYLQIAEAKVEKKGTARELYMLALAYRNAGAHVKAMHFAYQTFQADIENPQTWRFYIKFFFDETRFMESQDLLKEWVDSFCLVRDHYEERFPQEEPAFWTVKITERNQKMDFSELTEILKKTSDAAEESLQIFQEMNLSVVLLAGMTNKEIYETWNTVTYREGITVWIDRKGTAEIENLTFSNSTEIIIDISTLLTIERLDLLDDLNRTGGQFWVSQRQMSNILITLHEYQRVSEEGLKTIGMNNNQLHLHETTSEQLQNVIHSIQRIVDWIKSHAKLFGSPMSEYFDDNIPELCRDELNFSIERKIPILVDGYIVRVLLKQPHGVSSFNTMEFIAYLKKENFISEEEFIEKYLLLYHMGYKLIPFYKDAFFFSLKNMIYELDYKNRMLCTFFSDSNYKVEYRILCAAELIAKIWSEQETVGNKEFLTDMICNALGKGENKSKIIKYLQVLLPRYFNPILLPQLENTKLFLEKWLDKQIVL